MQIHDVEIKRVQPDVGNELSDNFYRNCVFCDKLVKITPLNFGSCHKIGGNEYCPFCLRHNFHHRNNHNILVFSYRAIIGYYYHKLYRVRNPRIWVSEIEAMLEDHAVIGLQNPALTYDPATLLWFADFNKIGTDTHKAPYEEVDLAIKKMLDVMNPTAHISHYAAEELWNRFHKAVHLFYQKRKRPKDRRMLIPTLHQITSTPEEEDFYDMTRNFNRSCLVVK